MKIALFSLLMLLVQNARAQYAYTDSLRRMNNRALLGDLFWSDVDDGFYVGPVAAWELDSPALGGEAKFYVAYYHHMISASAFVNARHLYASGPDRPHTAIGAGMHFSIFALEGNAYVGPEHTSFYLTPKVGLDWGSVSVFYGYGLRLGHRDFPSGHSHSLSVKYFLHLNAFAYHRSRKHSWMKYGSL